MGLTNIWSRLTAWWKGLFGRKPSLEPAAAPFYGRICLIIIDPVLQENGGRKLSDLLGWNDANQLANGLIEDLAVVSHGYAQYKIVERIYVDDFLLKEDGFRYSEKDYLRVVHTRHGSHQPDGVNYASLLNKYRIIEKINADEIDEVWTISFPWAGFYESRMAGPGAFWCNAPPLPDSGEAARRFIIMAFNFERGVGEMLESYGHRAESILSQVFQGVPEPENLWTKFTRHEKTHPGQAEVGNVHFAPNSRRDYDWGNATPVLSRCRNWQHFPDLSAPPQWVDCREWGNGDIRAHHRWWFSLMPHTHGRTSNISNNWWEYIVDPNHA